MSGQEVDLKKIVFFVVVLFSFTVGSLFAQNNVITIDANGKTYDQIVGEILLDWNDYHGKNLSITNVTFLNFGIREAIYWPRNATVKFTNWFKADETHQFYDRASKKDFYVYFRPADREGRKFVLDMDKKYYTTSRKITINGYYWKLQDASQTCHAFFVSSIVINDTKYIGKIPNF